MSAPYRAFNFSPGPAALPVEVLEEVQRDLVDYQGRGLSVMEMNHRSPEFEAIAHAAEHDFRRIANVPDDFATLFVAGGATLQFSMIPMNLTRPGDSVDFVVTGTWSKRAMSEAKRLVGVRHCVCRDEGGPVPTPDSWSLDPNAQYVHLASNETIDGVQFATLPALDRPLVVDMSSDILSRAIDWQRMGVVFASAQKNIGPAGLTLVVVRRDLLDRARPDIPSVLEFAALDQRASMVNTPPSFSWYLAGLVFRWVETEGGVDEMQRRSRRKAEKLYRCLDESNFYAARVDHDRSIMNVPFDVGDGSLDELFLRQANEAGLLSLRGHRSVGGMRASLYNAVPESAVDALVEFMAQFESEHA